MEMWQDLVEVDDVQVVVKDGGQRENLSSLRT